MATDTLSRSSSLSLDNYGTQSFPAISQIFQKHLEEAMTMIPEPASSTGCLLTDIGNSLIQASTIMTQLAEELVRGEHIQDNSRKVLQEIEAENDFSELDLFDYMNKKHAVLRYTFELRLHPRLLGAAAFAVRCALTMNLKNNAQDSSRRIQHHPRRMGPCAETANSSRARSSRRTEHDCEGLVSKLTSPGTAAATSCCTTLAAASHAFLSNATVSDNRALATSNGFDHTAIAAPSLERLECRFQRLQC
jgi:hypothetical protein